jgi:hypothetical protein
MTGSIKPIKRANCDNANFLGQAEGRINQGRINQGRSRFKVRRPNWVWVATAGWRRKRLLNFKKPAMLRFTLSNGSGSGVKLTIRTSFPASIPPVHGLV